MTSAYFAPLVLFPAIITGPGRYLTRCGEAVEIVKASQRHEFGCHGTYSNGIADKWHRSGRLFAGMLSPNDIVRPAGDSPDGVIVFYVPVEGEPSLAYSLWFRTADGGNSERPGIIEARGLRTPEAIRDAALAGATPFVRANWHTLEVSTPLAQRYGQQEGGYPRLKMVRGAA